MFTAPPDAFIPFCNTQKETILIEALIPLATLLGVAISAAKDATDIATNVKGLLDDTELDEIAAKRLISELLNNLIKVQTEHIAMQRMIAVIEQEQRQAEQFQAEAVRYRAKRTEQGSFVYELQPAQANGEPIHCICAACYNKKIKSILQPVAHNTFECGTCHGRVFMHDAKGSAIMIGPVSRFDGLS